MTLLGGLFSRKHKSPRPDDHAASEHSTAASDLDSPTSSYVTPNRSIPSNPNTSNLLHPDSARQNYPRSGQHAPPTMSSPTMSTSTNASGSSSRLRLFGRKKSNMSDKSPSTSPDPTRRSFQTALRPEQSRTSTDVEGTDPRRLRPPPSRSAIFAAYGDPNSALSTRSLPTETSNSPPTFYSLSPTPPPLPKKSSIFAWGKHNSPSPASSPIRLDTPPLNPFQDSLGSPNSLDGDHSFNLRSFRHIRPPSPTGSNSSLTPPIPRARPRGESVNSNASQRISVAAFREAQARRSQAGSPSPSFRSESPALHSRGKSPDALRGNNGPGGASRSTSHIPSQQRRRRSSMAITTTSDSDSAASSSEEDSEDDDAARPGRSRVASSFNKPGNANKTRAKSEIGHGHADKSMFKASDFPLPSRVPNSHVGHSLSPAPSSSQQSVNRVNENNKATNTPPRSPSNPSAFPTRQRASVSASALSPSMAAKRASIVAASNAKIANDARTSPAQSQNNLRTPQPSSQPSKTTLTLQTRPNAPRQSTADSSSDSEDDAPLATLVAPRRPGSAMSSYSNLHSRSTGNVTTRSATHMPPKPLIDINELTTPKRSYTSPLDGFTEGPTLLAETQRKATQPVHHPSPLVESPVSIHQQLPWQENGDIALNKELLTATVAPVKFATPITSPAQERGEFISSKELDTHMTSGGDAHQDESSTRRDSSPEVTRDPIIDRLSRAVKNTLQATSPTLSATASPPSSIVGSQPAMSPTPRAMSPSSGDASEASSSRRRSGIATTSAAAASVAQSRPSRSEMPFPRGKSIDASPPDEELAQLFGTAVQFLSGSEPASTPASTPAAKNDDTSSESSSSDSDTDDDDDDDAASKTKKKNDSKQVVSSIAPIPIKQRSPPPSFSVTSRPPVRQNNTDSTSGQSSPSPATTGYAPRQRSTTLQPTSSSSIFGSRKPSGDESISSHMHASKPSISSLNGNAALATASGSTTGSSSSSSVAAQAKNDRAANALRPPAVRQRSSTMITGVPLSAQMNARAHEPPEKPFAMRRNSPASSTGDSSSGRAPLTPKDGSEIGARLAGGANGSNGSVDGMRRHIKRRSVSFEDDIDELRPPNRSYLKGPSSSRGSSDAGDMSNEEDREMRRKERRRGEAKAAIELGNVVNGRGPVLSDDDDDMPINQGLNQRMSAMNPMMAMGNPMAAMQMGQMGYAGSSNPTAWSNPMGQPMLSPAQFMVPPPADPNFLAAHQHAMAIAKQAYQMAVAQQAMAAAADEWERGSTVGGFGGGGSVYGGSGSVYGGGGGSVYGGGGGSVYGGSQMGTPYGMMGGMGMMPSGWGSSASMYGGGGARSMYGGSHLGIPTMMSNSRSEYGGGGGENAGNWSSSRSSYGESFGPEQKTRRNGQLARRGGRDSGSYPPMPTIMSQPASGRNSPDVRTPARPTKLDSPHRGVRKAPPPSSWKAS